MEPVDHEQAKELIKELILPFYGIERDMRVPSSDSDIWRKENDAEHSWSVGVLACSLAPQIDSNLDIGLVSQFALVHDLVEVYAGDTSVFADKDSLATKQENERRALEQIVERFGRFPWLIGTVDAYERQDSPEALYIRAIDKYIALCIRFMDEGAYYRERGITKETFDERHDLHRKKAHGHPGAAEYYEMIREEFDQHPEYFAVSKE